jgi:hypothetical protein
VGLRVGATGDLTRVGSWPLGGWDAMSARALPLGDGRVAAVHRGVRILSVS